MNDDTKDTTQRRWPQSPSERVAELARRWPEFLQNAHSDFTDTFGGEPFALPLNISFGFWDGPFVKVQDAKGRHICDVHDPEVAAALVAVIEWRGADVARLVGAEVEALRKDAQRYRWLRDTSVPPHQFYLSVPIEFDGVRFAPHEVDAAIDAAIDAANGGV